MKKKLIRIILTAVLLAGAWLVEHFATLPMWQVLLVYLVPYLVISYDVLGEAVEGIMEGDPFDENFLMSIATIGSIAHRFPPGARTTVYRRSLRDVVLPVRLNSLSIMRKIRRATLSLN